MGRPATKSSDNSSDKSRDKSSDNKTADFQEDFVRKPEPTNHHQIATVDEFTAARIHRLWEDWQGARPMETRNKHEFHRHVITRCTGLENIRLATLYVVLARHDARFAAAEFSGA